MSAKRQKRKLTVQQRIAALRRYGWTDQEIGAKLDLMAWQVDLIMHFRPVQRGK